MAFVQEVKKNVNATLLNGAPGEAFLGAESKAADSSLLNGSSAYLASDGKAADSSLLNGASNYSQTGHTHSYIPTASTGTAAPDTTPAAVGLLFIDTTGKNAYISVGTSASSDWVKIN